MELRSAQKPSEKPSPRFRLSLGRSVGAGLQHNGRRCRSTEGGVYHHRLLKRRSRQCVPKPLQRAELPRQRTLTLEKGTAEEDDDEDDDAENEWEKEEEQQEKKRRKSEKEEHPDIPHAQEMTEDHAPSTQEAVVTDGKPEHCASSTDCEVKPPGTDGGSEKSASTTITITHENKLITDVSASGGGASQDKPMTDNSLKSSTGLGVITDRVQNRASVITVRHLIDRFVQVEEKETSETDSKGKSETDKDEVTAECTTTLQLSAEVRPEESRATESTRHPGKVIVTNVTINSLTVTFKEAMTAEGFFSSYGLQV